MLDSCSCFNILVVSSIGLLEKRRGLTSSLVVVGSFVFANSIHYNYLILLLLSEHVLGTVDAAVEWN